MKKVFKKFSVVFILCLVVSSSLVKEAFAEMEEPPLSTYNFVTDEPSLDIPNDYLKETVVTPINKRYLNDTFIYDLWQQGYYGKGTKIAVIDSGVESSHEDLNIYKTIDCISKVNEGCFETDGDEDSQFHGTHVSGIINAQHNNKGIDGVAPLADVYVLKIAKATSNGYLFYDKAYENAVDWAIKNNIQIINFSIGFEKEKPGLAQKIKEAINKGILFVAAAGNNGRSKYAFKGTTVDFPANIDGVITVSATTDKDNLNAGSSIGPEVYIAAPGYGINSTVPISKDNTDYFKNIDDNSKTVTYDWDKNNPEGYQQLSGTSMASPVVAGTLALLKEKYPNASSERLKEYLRFMTYYNDSNKLNERNDPITNMKRNDEFGYGFLQAEIGRTTVKKIVLEETTKIYDVPDTKYYTGATISPQTVTVVREGERGTRFYGWYEIKTYLGYRWVKPGNYYEDVNLKINLFNTTTLYTDTEKTANKGVLEPQTVTAIKRKQSWFQINTSLGPMWIQPNNYTIGDFKVKIYGTEKLYATKNGAYTGATLGAQEVNVTYFAGDWFQIQSYIGTSWIKPFSWRYRFNVTLNDSYSVYNLNNQLENFNVEDISYISDGKPLHSGLTDQFTIDIKGTTYIIYPLNYYNGEYNLKLTQPITYLYNNKSENEASVGKLAPQTVTVVERKYEINNNNETEYWFLIKTSLGLKWCKPNNGTYIEYQ